MKAYLSVFRMRWKMELQYRGAVVGDQDQPEEHLADHAAQRCRAVLRFQLQTHQKGA